jgi:hypothetical protein
MGETGAVGTRRRPWPAHPLAVVALAVFFLVPVALLGADAVGDKRYPEAVSVVEWQAQIVAAESGPGADRSRWRVSADGGLTWRPTSPDELGMTESEDDGYTTLPTQSCAPDQPGHCYRIVPGHLRVEESLNGGHSWWIAWSVPDDERRRLARCYQNLGEPAEHLSSKALAVVSVDGGHAVVVANGRDGYVVRAPDGTWTRTGFGTTVDPSGQARPKVRPAPPIENPSARDAAPQMVAGVLAGLAVMAVAGSAAAWRVARWSVGAAAALLAIGGLLALAGGFGWRDTNAALPVPVLALGLVAALAGAAGVLAVAVRRGAARKLTVALAAGTGAAVAVVDAALFAAWADSAIAYRSAAFAAQALAVAGLVAAVALVTRWRPVDVTGTARRDEEAGEPPYADL